MFYCKHDNIAFKSKTIEIKEFKDNIIAKDEIIDYVVECKDNVFEISQSIMDENNSISVNDESIEVNRSSIQGES